jgi:hypothetical protein
MELEAAGNPAYVVALLDAAGAVNHLSPMVFATVFPASDLARRMARTAGEGEEAIIISRHASGERAQFAVLDPKTLRKRHEQLEVIERTFAESDGPL